MLADNHKPMKQSDLETDLRCRTQQLETPPTRDDEGPADRTPSRSPNGDSVDGLIWQALDRLDARRERVRDPETGRWTLGNGGRLETGQRSDLFWMDLEPARMVIERRVCQQLGLASNDPRETVIGLAGAYAEARLIRRSEFLQLTRLEDAATNAKMRRRLQDRQRRHLTAWALAFDRELKAARSAWV